MSLGLQLWSYFMDTISEIHSLKNISNSSDAFDFIWKPAQLKNCIYHVTGLKTLGCLCEKLSELIIIHLATFIHITCFN